ncbi:MAG: hypothetical protein ACREOO_23770 [bacterium]
MVAKNYFVVNQFVICVFAKLVRLSIAHENTPKHPLACFYPYGSNQSRREAASVGGAAAYWRRRLEIQT